MTVKDFARAHGYAGADYIGRWRGYACYEPYMSTDVSCTGLPLLILVKDGSIRMSTPAEAMQQLDEM